MLRITNERIGYTHDKTAYMYKHDRIRLTHDRIGKIVKNKLQVL